MYMYNDKATLCLHDFRTDFSALLHGKVQRELIYFKLIFKVIWLDWMIIYMYSVNYACSVIYFSHQALICKLGYQWITI